MTFSKISRTQTATVNDNTLSQALSWGFICNLDEQGKWQILPQQAVEGWKLLLVEDRWLLIVNDVPQMLCHSFEAIEFLERRRPKRKSSTLRNLLCN